MTTAQLCEDCEQGPATTTRIASDGEPIALCGGCDPGPGCRPLVVRDRYSNGRPMFTARCPQCGWTQIGSSESYSTGRNEADRHKELSA